MPKDELIAALEAATGPDRDIDLALHELKTGKQYRCAAFGGAFGPDGGGNQSIIVQVLPFDDTEDAHKYNCWGHREVILLPAYTASIDAALTLAKDRRPVAILSLMQTAMGLWLQSASTDVADLARFICIAALRATERGEAGR